MKPLFALLLLVAPALAQTCPGSNASYSASLPPPLSFMLYDLAPPLGVPSGMLTVFAANGAPETFIGVPQSVAQQFPLQRDPVQYFNTSIRPVYHELLLAQKAPCPVLTSTPGALWSR
jgi:hypothetical protein